MDKEVLDAAKDRKPWKKQLMILALVVLNLAAFVGLFLLIEKPFTPEQCVSYVNCIDNLRMIDGAVMQYGADRSRSTEYESTTIVTSEYPESIDDLVGDYLKSAPRYCELDGHKTGGTYSLDTSATPPVARCSVHGTARTYDYSNKEYIHDLDWETPAAIIAILIFIFGLDTAICLWKAKPRRKGEASEVADGYRQT